MKSILFQYLVVFLSMLLLSVLWEFWIENLATRHLFEGMKAENLAERIEYVVTVMIFCSISLIYPFTQAVRQEVSRESHEQERERLISELQASIAEIRTLRGIIPICSYCRRIRTDTDVWTQLESYVREHSHAQFSHGICPQCMKAQVRALEEER
jgi:hypothetical protein